MLEKLLQELKDGNYTNALRFLNLLIMLLSREADIIDPIAARDEKSEEYGTKIKYDQQDDDIFWGYVFANVNKEINFSIPAPMGVTYRDNIFQLYFNPSYINKDWTVMNLLEIVKHEGYHILYNHMELFKDLEFPQAVNYATDCEINQYLPNLPKEGIRLDDIKRLTNNNNLKERAGSLYYYEELKKVLDNLPKDKQCTCGAKEHNERVQKQQQEQQNSQNQNSQDQQEQGSQDQQEQGSNEQNQQSQGSNGQGSENQEQSPDNQEKQGSNGRSSNNHEEQGSNGQSSDNQGSQNQRNSSNGQGSNNQNGQENKNQQGQDENPQGQHSQEQNNQGQDANNGQNPQNPPQEQLKPRKCTCGCNKKNNKFDTHEMWKDIYNPENNNFIPVSKATQNLMNEVVRQIESGNKGRGAIPGNIIDQINKLNEPPQIKWQSLVVKQIGKQVCGKRKSPNRLNRRDPKSIYKKGNLNDRLQPIVVAFDVSGSVSNKELMYFLNELQALTNKLKLPVTYIQFDWEIQNVDTIAPGEKPSFDIHGRGGTSFQPVFDYLKDEQYPKETQLFIFTDGGGESEINNRGYKKYQWIISGNQHLSVQNESRPIIRLNIKDFEY